MLACACVGPPPSPPQHDGTSLAEETSAASTDHGTTLTPADGTTFGTDDTSGVDITCGDGIVEMPEECDLGDLNGTGMYCTEACTTNICGDGYVGPGEACDDGNGSNEDLCTTKCGPTSCGDGVVQGIEECDEGRNNATDGACLPSCIAASCGDAFIHQGMETCDGTNVGAETCASQGFDDGVLVCLSDCSGYDTGDCFACGNGVIESGENCDGTAFTDDVTCESFAPGGSTVSSGQLSCDNNCTVINSSACTFCGDGMAEGAEVCDEGDLNGVTCMTQGFLGGVLACAANCMAYDTSGCTNCGNDVVNAGEDCDGAAIGAGTCASELGAQYGGSLTCNSNCTYGTAGCCLIINQPCNADDECCTGNCTAYMGAVVCRPA